MKSIQFFFDEHQQLYAKKHTSTLEKANSVAELLGINCEIHEEDDDGYSIFWESENACNLLHKLRKENTLNEVYHCLIPELNFNFIRIDEHAFAPQKAHFMDAGYDIHVIGIKKFDPQTNVVFYHTGIKIRPPYGYYFEMYGRSSLSKTGHMLANNVGIIDANYRGELIIALKKDPNVPFLELPCKVAQIIPKQLIHMEAIEVRTFDETQRNEGGFGSTN